MRKRLLNLVSVSAIGLVIGGAAAYADTSATSTTPAMVPGFGATLTALYLQPNASGNNLNYAVFTKSVPVPAPNWQQQSVNPKYSPAFNLGLQYNLANQTDQLKLDWTHLDTSDSDSIAYAGTGTSVAPPYAFGPTAQLSGRTANSTAKFNVDSSNLVFSHLMDVSNHLQFNLFAGVNAAYVKENIVSNYTGVDGSGSSYAYSISTDSTSTFTGIGPKFGVDGTYFIGSHFGILAEMAGSLLVGTMQSDTSFNTTSANPAYVSGGTSNTKLSNQHIGSVVPEIESRLGLTYVIPFKTGGSSLTFQGGYMFAEYINGINQVEPTSLVPEAFQSGTVAIETSAQESSDMTMNGPYASVTYVF